MMNDVLGIASLLLYMTSHDLVTSYDARRPCTTPADAVRRPQMLYDARRHLRRPQMVYDARRPCTTPADAVRRPQTPTTPADAVRRPQALYYARRWCTTPADTYNANNANGRCQKNK